MYRKSTGELIEAATSLNDTVLQEATINARQAKIIYLKTSYCYVHNVHL